MRLHPRTQRFESTSLRVGDTNSVLSFPHCFVTNDVVEWRVSNSGSIRIAQERRESSLSSLISCRDKSWESYSATAVGRGRGGGADLPRFITLGAWRTLFHLLPSSFSFGHLSTGLISGVQDDRSRG